MRRRDETNKAFDTDSGEYIGVAQHCRSPQFMSVSDSVFAPESSSGRQCSQPATQTLVRICSHTNSTSILKFYLHFPLVRIHTVHPHFALLFGTVGMFQLPRHNGVQHTLDRRPSLAKLLSDIRPLLYSEQNCIHTHTCVQSRVVHTHMCAEPQSCAHTKCTSEKVSEKFNQNCPGGATEAFALLLSSHPPSLRTCYTAHAHTPNTSVCMQTECVCPVLHSTCTHSNTSVCVRQAMCVYANKVCVHM